MTVGQKIKFVCGRRVVLEIKKIVENKTLTVELAGRLDATTSPELDKELEESLEGIKNLVFDFAELSYIASAGLRTLLKYQKQTDKHDCTMQIKNVSPEVREIFEITGFIDFLNIVEVPIKKLSIEF